MKYSNNITPYLYLILNYGKVQGRCSKLTMSFFNVSGKTLMIKNAKATHIFSAKNVPVN